jgi:putative ABC transport system permease protein
MKISDYIGLSSTNLWNRKLRTFLTICGVTVGIGALVSMISFGQGIQKNLSESFQSLELFNSLTVFPGSGPPRFRMRRGQEREKTLPGSEALLDEAALKTIEKIKGVAVAFPEVRFPALIRFAGQEEFRLVQVIPARVAASKLFKLRAGKPFASDEEDTLIISASLLLELGVKDFSSAIGQTMEISSLSFNFAALDPADFPRYLEGEKLPFSSESYIFQVAGVVDSLTMGGPNPLQSDIYIPPGSAERVKKLPFANVWDLFRAREGRLGYSAVNIRLSSPEYVDSVKSEVKALGFSTFALLDQFEEIKKSFIYMDMMLAAVGMIAIFVASLGIINTMVMSILERYKEIGVMKAVGASDGDVKKVFFFESSAIGFLGGVLGLGLGWAVSRLINQVVNYFLGRQGIPHIDYFYFPWWLCLGAIAFAVLVSLASGIYPALRAARVDPVVALRHD